jgi:hypothetical protein
MTQNPVSKNKDQKDDDRQHQAALAVSTKQIAKEAVRGGPKSVKKDKRPTGHGQKG